MQIGRTIQSGFTYLVVLMLIGAIGLGLAAAGSLWQTESRRIRESELLFIGNQYRLAIKSYYELEPAQPRLPQSVDELLKDDRGPNVIRHLRKAWPDPVSGSPFQLIAAPDNQGIVGVHSPATGHPFKVSGFSAQDELFSNAASYGEWRFVFDLPGKQAQPPNPLP